MTQTQVNQMNKHLIKCTEANERLIKYEAEMRYKGNTLRITNALDYQGSTFKSYRIAYVWNKSKPSCMNVIQVTSVQGERTLALVDDYLI